MKRDEQYGYVVHSRWSDDEEPKATVIRSYDGWLWHDICVTSPDSAVEISEALGCMAELHDLRKGADEIERLRRVINSVLACDGSDRTTHVTVEIPFDLYHQLEEAAHV